MTPEQIEIRKKLLSDNLAAIEKRIVEVQFSLDAAENSRKFLIAELEKLNGNA